MKRETKWIYVFISSAILSWYKGKQSCKGINSMQQEWHNRC